MKNTTKAFAMVLAAGAGLLASCNAVGPDYAQPQLATPDAWTEPAQLQGPVDKDWWKSFDDAELDRLVALAETSNTDLRVAVARLRESRARLGIVRGALLPDVDANASYTNSHFSENGFLKGLGGSSDAGQSESPPGAIVPGQEINLYQIGLDASWEIDLFGRQRRAIEAASADITASEYELRDALVAVVAEVADQYVQLRALQERLRIARATAQSEQDTADVVQEQFDSGVASELDLARANSEAQAAAARVPRLEADERSAIRRLEMLIGAMPGTLDEELTGSAAIPSPPEALAVGIPSDVLRRRPDIRAAERRLAAATARIGVATAELFPRFSLTGSFGLQSQELGDLPEGDSRFWSIGPAVRWPLLDFGRIRSNIAVQNARAQEAEAAYEGAILRSLSDVEIALVQLSRERRRSEQLTAAANDAQHAASVAEELYRGGLLEYLDLLDAQRTAYQAQDAAAQSNAAIASATISLYRALGGGWEDSTVAAAETEPKALP